MKTLTRLHLIHWNYIEYETIEFDSKINFFVGGTGAGKSTVIDAIQFLLLGNPSGKYFNQAAHEKSDRKLIEYLCGMYGENESKKDYLRDKQDFTSYIVAEFIDEDRGKKFCLGVVFDVDAAKKISHTFFFLDAPLPEHGFLILDKKIPMSISQLRNYYKGHEETFKAYIDNEYREALVRRHLGKFDNQFFSLFKKAIALKITENIKDFIMKFICEEDVLKIDDMQEAIRCYKKLEDELKRTQQKTAHLIQIETLFKDWRLLKDKEPLYKFIISQSDIEALAKQILKHKEEHELLLVELEKLEIDVVLITEDLRIAGEEKIQLEFKILNETRHEDELKDRRDTLQKEIVLLDVQRKDYIKSVDYHFRWLNLMDKWEEVSKEDVTDYEHIKNGIIAFSDYTLEAEGFTALREQLLRTKRYFNQLENKYALEHSEKKEQIEELIVQTAKLEDGHKTYPPNVTDVQRIISDELFKKHGKAVEVHVLADLLEIENKDWTRAIEGYFKKKFSLIIEPTYCIEAVEIYDRLSNKHGVDIIDTVKLSEQYIRIQPNSLAEELRTTNEIAKKYVNYALGNVIKCNSVHELNQHRVSITKDCMAYGGFIFRKLDPFHCNNQYIGQESIRYTIKQNKLQIDKLQKDIDVISNLRDALDSETFHRNVFEQEEIDGLIEKRSSRLLIPELELTLTKVISDLGQLEENTYVLTLKAELRVSEQNIKNLKSEEETMRETIGGRKIRIPQIEAGLPIDEADKANLQAQLIVDYGAQWILSVGMPKFIEEYEKRQDTEQLKNKYKRLNRDLGEEVELSFEKLLSRRKAFLETFKMYWNAHSEDNKEYSQALEEYQSTELTKYEDRIRVQKEKAYKQFKDDFIYKMKNNIKDTERQIKELNRAIKNANFGKNRYEFVVSPSLTYRNFYNMLTDEMLIGQDTLFSGPFVDVYGETIDELFSLIIDTGLTNEEDRSILQQNIRKFTDYRTYLDFEMKEYTGDTSSFLSKTMTKNSGGETQNPFYIVVLASFVRLYELGNPKNKNIKNNNIRLIVFDEVFNKMGEKNIEATINLMRHLNFQVIMAAPDDKTALICPEVEKVFHFKNNDKKSIEIASFSKERAIELYC